LMPWPTAAATHWVIMLAAISVLKWNIVMWMLVASQATMNAFKRVCVCGGVCVCATTCVCVCVCVRERDMCVWVPQRVLVDVPGWPRWVHLRTVVVSQCCQLPQAALNRPALCRICFCLVVDIQTTPTSYCQSFTATGPIAVSSCNRLLLKRLVQQDHACWMTANNVVYES
jgi:hypothetical protein